MSDTFVGCYNLHNDLSYTVSQLFPEADCKYNILLPFLD